jgi:transporter family-2 protein
MNNVYILLFVALIAGVVLPVQTAVNNKMALSMGSPILGALVSFVIGTLSIFTYAVVSGESLSSLTNSKNAPTVAWVGGVLGAFFVTSTIILLPRLGVAVTVSLIIAGQLIAAIIMDHYGLLGVAVKEISLFRVAGILLIVAGVVLVRKF